MLPNVVVLGVSWHVVGTGNGSCTRSEPNASYAIAQAEPLP